MRSVWTLAILAALILSALLAQQWGGDDLLSDLLDPQGRVYTQLDPSLLATGTAFGLLLLGAWLAGRLAKQIALPMITGYLVFGLLAGPSGPIGVITQDQLGYLKLVDDLAIALIALTAGSEIRLQFLRGAIGKILTVLGVQVGFIFVGMTVLFWFLLSNVGWIDESLLAASMVLASVATVSSPAVVIALLTELHARGEFARLTLAVTVCKDLIVIVLFGTTLALAQGDSAGPSLVQEITWHIGGSLVGGVMVGVLLTAYLRRIHAHLPIFLVFSGFGIALVSEALHLDPLIMALIAGMLMRNAWEEESEEFFETVEDLSLPVYCVFFGVAGAKLDLSIIIATWEWALVAAGARFVLVVAGTWLGARLANLEPRIRRLLWTGFVSRAGVSIALAAIVGESLGSEESAAALYNFILASIAIDEIFGPLLFKVGLVKAGETGGQQDQSQDQDQPGTEPAPQRESP